MFKILFADDHQLFLTGLRLVVERIDGWEVAGEVRSGQEVIHFLKTEAIDCLLIDVNMPDGNGIDTTRFVKELYPELKVLCISMSANLATVRQMINAGADGYLLKSVDVAELRKALELVMSGEAYICEELRTFMEAEGEQLAKSIKRSASDLTLREQEIVRLIANGLTNEAIAQKLYLSRLTVDTHRKNILKKLNCRNTGALIKYLFENQILN